MVQSPGVIRNQREVVHTPPSMKTRGSSGQKQNAAGEVAADELCFSTPRRIKRGLFNSPLMNTRSCLSAQKQKEGPGSRPVGPDEEEVTGANDEIVKKQSNLVFRIGRVWRKPATRSCS